MRIRPVAALLPAIACSLAAVALAEKDAGISPLLAQPSKSTPKETFEGSKLAKGWVVNKGEFQVREGTLVGWEKKEDMHAAVLTLQKPFKNALCQFSFNRDGATGFNVSLNHPKGHLFRIVLAEESLTIVKDKDKNDAASKPVVLAKADAKLPSGVWHTVLLEIVGDKVAVQTDGGIKLQASHPSLAVDKTGFRFVTRGSKLFLDDVSVWDTK